MNKDKTKKPINPPKKTQGHMATSSKLAKSMINPDPKKPSHKVIPSEHKLDNKEVKKINQKENKEELKKKPQIINLSDEKEKEEPAIIPQNIIGTSNIEFNTGQMKKLNEEKKDLMHQLSILKRENIELKKKLEESEKVNNDLMDTIDETQKSSEQFIKDKNDMENFSKKCQNELKEIKLKNDELNNIIIGLKEDIEILQEDNQTKDLETEVLQKKLEELTKENEDLKKNINENNLNDNNGDNNENKNNKNNIENKNKENINLNDVNFSPEQISHMEEVIAELSNQLKQTSEQRDYAIQYYKEEIEKIQKNLNEEKEKNAIIPEKDELIRQLTEKLKDYEAIMESLKSQITALSPSSDMFEEVIMEKDKLENELEELKLENEKLKEDLQNDEEMINDLDTTLKISEEMMKNSQIETLNYKKKEEEYYKKFTQLDENEKKLLEKLNEMKQINQILKDEVSKFKDSNINLDDVLNKNLTTSNKIKMLQRQKILTDLSDLDVDKLNLKNKLINAMIPKKIFEKGCLESFEKFLNIYTYRKKTLELIFNILENDILTEDLGKNLNQNSEEKMEKVEADNLKKLSNFYQLVLTSLSNFNSILFKIEIHLCKIQSEKFEEITLSENFKNLYLNFCSAFSIIDNLINLIKQDMFSIQFQSNAEGLKIIIDNLKNQINSIEGIEEDNLYNYSTNSILYYIIITCSFKTERIDIILNNLDTENKLSDIANNFNNIYSSLKQIISSYSKKFFKEIPYETSNKIFDITSSYYIKFIETLNNIDKELAKEEIYNIKYSNLLDILNKILIVMNSSFEKFESENENNKKEDNLLLPISEWNKITDELNTELESIVKMQEDLEIAKKEVKQAKLEKLEMQNKYEDLERVKNENEQKLGKLQIQIGKVTELEVQNEEKNKYIDKYKMAIDNLQQQSEKDKNEIIKLNMKIKDLENEKKNLDRKNSRQLSSRIDKNTLIGSSSLGINEKNLVNTLSKLINERKSLKNKIMKDKLITLINDNNSYMNNYIIKNLKNSKNENEKELYKEMENQIINLNNNYNKVRMKLSLPKILDLSNNKSKENLNAREIELNKLRIDYMKDYDSLFSQIFNDNNGNNFKNLIDHDVSKSLNYYGDKPLLIGKIRFFEKGEKIKNDANTNNNNIKKIPVILSEDNLKKLNETFNY